ncbi:hypothetical protein D083_2294 [Dickeya solani RNS 08.23.3.1.A]|nr:hypothetical protein D083_2294 [Dickeya solani RNS 08.23.3.1.A]
MTRFCTAGIPDASSGGVFCEQHRETNNPGGANVNYLINIECNLLRVVAEAVC